MFEKDVLILDRHKVLYEWNPPNADFAKRSGTERMFAGKSSK